MSFKEIIENAENAINEKVRAEEGDYLKDGLLQCGKCDTPKQSKVVIEELGIERAPYCLCECEKDKLNAELKRLNKQSRIRQARENCFHDSILQSWTFAKDDMQNPRITQAMQKYVDNFPEMLEKGQGLLLYGLVGRGKTFAAAEVANALIDKGYTALATSFKDIENQAFDAKEQKQKYFDSFKKFDLLFLDDLGVERDTQFMQEIVYKVINDRYLAGLPMIITTNLTAEELKNPQEIKNQRIFDRVLECCLPIKIEGVNRRHKNLSAKATELNNLLGL